MTVSHGSPAPSVPASQDTSFSVIWAAMHVLTVSSQYAFSVTKTGKTPEITIRPIEDCSKVKG